MRKIDKFDDIRERLDVKFQANYKPHKLLYKFKSLYSPVNVAYDNKLNTIKLELPLKTNLDIILEIMNMKRIYAPTKSQVNDPFEGVMIRCEYGVAGNFMHIARRDLSPFAETQLRKYRFLSLTSKADKPQMWGYYADIFKGVCFVFSTKKLLVIIMMFYI